MRVARPTDNLAAIAEMYAKGLDLTVLARFEDHRGFDGVILGHPKQPYHIEFTSQRGHQVGKAPTRDYLQVFYIPDKGEWEAGCTQMISAGFREVSSYNPYWDLQGRTFEDINGVDPVDEATAMENANRIICRRHARHHREDYFGERVSACVFTSRLCLSTTRRNSRSIVLNAS